MTTAPLEKEAGSRASATAKRSHLSSELSSETFSRNASYLQGGDRELACWFYVVLLLGFFNPTKNHATYKARLRMVA
jgi:hypothetical protein